MTADSIRTPLDPQARQLNERIAKSCPAVLEMLSARGRAIFFPKLGILAQSAAAQGKDINATMGIALEEDGGPMSLPCISSKVNLPGCAIFPYAPSFGRPDLRKAWKTMLLSKNPSLRDKTFSLPVVTSALTHGLSMCGYLFCDNGDSIILPDLFWENYDLVFTHAYGAGLRSFSMFDGNGRFNVAGLRAKLAEGGPGGKKIVCLNFPNNPAGYTPTAGEMAEIAEALRSAAEAGSKIVAIIDDAYFGLVFVDGVPEESIFAALCDLHPNILALKLDGPTKEDYVWGFRAGFITFGTGGGTTDVYDALEAKAAGAIRGSISNASNLAQSLLMSAWESPDYARQKAEKRGVLERRYWKVRGILDSHPEYSEFFEALPFNSGYFMCVRMKGIDPELLRGRLLEKYSTGVIVLSGVVRLAFSSVPTGKLELLFNNIFRASAELAARDGAK